MRSRIPALFLCAILVLSALACSKKEPTQSAATPGAADTAATTSQPAAGQSAAGQMGQQQAQQMTPAPSQQATPAPEPPPPPPPLVVPAGTHLTVRIGNTISTKTSEVGQSFTGTLVNAVAVKSEVAIPAGAGVTGTVVESKSPGKFKGEGILTITVNSVNIGGVPTAVETAAYSKTIKGKGKRTAVAVGGGTGAGALIGGIAGGGKGALIGGLVGAGAGTAGAAFTGNKDLEIPAESVVTFRLASPITVNRVAKSAKEQMSQSQ